MSEPAAISGTCLCGTVTVTVANPVGWVGACHCRMCQRWSGGLFACFPAAEATVTVAGPVTEFQSSALARRAFCSRCGTQLWMRDVTAGADYDLLPGIFDAAKDWPLTSEIYCDQAMAAFALAGNHKRATAATYREKNPAVADIGEESDA